MSILDDLEGLQRDKERKLKKKKQYEEKNVVEEEEEHRKYEGLSKFSTSETKSEKELEREAEIKSDIAAELSDVFRTYSSSTSSSSTSRLIPQTPEEIARDQKGKEELEKRLLFRDEKKKLNKPTKLSSSKTEHVRVADEIAEKEEFETEEQRMDRRRVISRRNYLYHRTGKELSLRKREVHDEKYLQGEKHGKFSKREREELKEKERRLGLVKKHLDNADRVEEDQYVMPDSVEGKPTVKSIKRLYQSEKKKQREEERERRKGSTSTSAIGGRVISSSTGRPIPQGKTGRDDYNNNDGH